MAVSSMNTTVSHA